MSRFEAIRLVPRTDPDYLAWKAWNDAAARERRAALAAARTSPAGAAAPSTCHTAICAPAAAPTPSTEHTTTPLARATAGADFLATSPDPAAPVSADAHNDAGLVRARACRQFGRDAEYVVRRALRSVLPVSDRRILRYAFQKEDGRWTTRYRELDVVALAGRRLYIFEVKATSRADVVDRGIAQLSFVRDVLAESFLDVITTLIVVDTSAGDGSSHALGRAIARHRSLVRVDTIADLTTAPVIHAIHTTPDEIAALAPLALDLSFLSPAA